MSNSQQDITQDSTEATYNHVLKYTGLFGGVQGLTMLMAIARNMITAKLLGPNGTGLINIFNNVIKLTNNTTNLGLSFSAVKYVAELDDSRIEERESVINSVRTLSVATGLLGVLVMLVLCNVISYFTFDSSEWSWAFAALSPIMLMLAVQTGEIAILKGLKRLKSLAMVSVVSSLFILLVCAISYIAFRMQGIVIALLASNAVILLVTLYYSNKVMPWKVNLKCKDNYKGGIPMLKLGLGYLVAGVFGQGAEYIIRTCVLAYGTLADVGLYCSGYVLAVTYAGIVFVAIEADFFPRLSSVNNDQKQSNFIVNQQIEICVLLIAPTLILFVIAMPIIVPILYSSEFVNAEPMAICATGYMFFKALTLPVAYLPLAKGDSKVYMFTELLYDMFIAVAIPFAYKEWGLIGTGWMLTIAGCFDFLLIHICYYVLYGFKFDFRRLDMYVAQGLLFAISIYAAFSALPIVHWGVGIGALIISVLFTFRILRKKANIIALLKKKYGSK